MYVCFSGPLFHECLLKPCLKLDLEIPFQSGHFAFNIYLLYLLITLPILVSFTKYSVCLCVRDGAIEIPIVNCLKFFKLRQKSPQKYFPAERSVVNEV